MSALASGLSVLRARWFWSLVGAVTLSLLIWFFGDLFGIGEERPLESPLARLVAVLSIAVAWGAWNLLAQARSRRSNEKLVAALAEPSAERDSGSAELAELERRFAGALDHFKRRRLGKKGNRRWLYELPWYVMIGPPGSGKSTALAQSGLRLRAGQVQELRGTGGTRYCDWVFTDEAVLLDTAGRYTTQDSDPQVDRSAWLGFLDLLKKRRPRRPLNGVLVALSTRDLLQDCGTDHAAHIRARLEEIEDRLGMRLPVYLVVTKADLVAGFDAFFGDFTERQREQVWGHTFDHRPGHADAPEPAELREALAALVARLDRGVPGRLEAEPDPERRALVFSFPAQVADLAEEIVRFAERCFRPTAYERGAWLRGVYLTSGTQAGTPIDRLLAAVARNVGVAVAPPAPADGGDRSFFLRRLLEQVVFGEANLAGHDLARERRDRLVRGAALASLAFVAAGAVAAWSWSFAGNRDRDLRIEGELEAWSRQARPFAQARLTAADADFTAVLPLLDKLGDLKAELERPDPLGLRMGLSQRPTAEAQLGVAYRAGLANLLLPRLVLATGRDLRVRLQDPDYLVEGLKVYLALSGGAPVDPALLEEFFALGVENRSKEAVASTRRHVAALAAILPELDAQKRPMLDVRLVADAQAALARVPLPKRAYDALVSHPAIKTLPGWKATEHAGPAAPAVLVRRSGRPLGAEIPAVLTYDGFHQVFLPRLDEVARGVYAEYWVLSGRGTPDAPDSDISGLKSGMLQLYYDDAVAAWDGLLRDVTLAPMDTLDQAIDVTKALSGPSSPLKLLYQAVVRETALTVPPPEPARAEGQGAAAAAGGARGAGKNLERLARLIRPGSAAASTEAPGAPVEARFTQLRQFVEGANGAPPALDEALSAFGALHAKLAEAAASPNPGEAFARMGSAAAQLASLAQRLPEPVKQVLDGAQKRATDLGRSGVRQQLNTVWRTDVLPFCRAAIGRRFPFAPGSSADATADDVSRLFGPNGLVQGFVKGQLANLVDTPMRGVWRDKQGLGLQPGSLAQLARAQRITSALFGNGSNLKVSFHLTPLSLSGTASAATLDVDGQELRYAHGPAGPKPFTWPGTSGTNTVRLSFAPTGGGAPATVVKEGPWALLRILHEGGFQRTDRPDVFEGELQAGGHAMRLRLLAGSVDNPFDPSVLHGFSCPESL